MSIFVKVLIGVAACIGSIAAYFKFTKKEQPDKALKGNGFQCIEDFNSEVLLTWVEENLPDAFISGKVRIFPQDKILELMKGTNVPLGKLKKCIYFDVINEKEEVVLKKLILPQHIGEEFNCILQGKVYIIPLES